MLKRPDNQCGVVGALYVHLMSSPSFKYLSSPFIMLITILESIRRLSCFITTVSFYIDLNHILNHKYFSKRNNFICCRNKSARTFNCFMPLSICILHKQSLVTTKTHFKVYQPSHLVIINYPHRVSVQNFVFCCFIP